MRAESPVRELYVEVLAQENGIAGNDNSAGARKALRVADLLFEARELIAASFPEPPLPAAQPCEQLLQPVTSEPLGSESLKDAMAGTREAGRPARRETRLVRRRHSPARPITHDVDITLRDVNEPLAINLCLSIVEIERYLGDKYDATVMEEELSNGADFLE